VELIAPGLWGLFCSRGLAWSWIILLAICDTDGGSRADGDDIVGNRIETPSRHDPVSPRVLCGLFMEPCLAFAAGV
jgi:hypothetical protein